MLPVKRPTSAIALAVAILLTACGPKPAPPAPPQAPPPPLASAASYCKADICADADNIAESHIDQGPDFLVHRFTLKDGSTAGVYVGNAPQRPPPDTPSTVEIVDGIACERFDISGPAPQVQIFCQWSKDSPTAIHAFANGPTNSKADVKASQAAALILSLRRCDEKTECPWPK